MADVEISYKGSTIASMSASGTKTLLTEGKYCEDDITVAYTSPGGGGGTLITKSITENGTYDAEDDNADGYSSVTVNVSGNYGDQINLIPGAQGLNSTTSNTGGAYIDITSTYINTRRMLVSLFGDMEFWYKYQSTANHNLPSKMHAISIPSGKTKLAVTADKACQVYVVGFHKVSSTSYPNDGNSGWINSSEEYSLPSGATHCIIQIRVDSNNTAFTESNTPTRMSIVFS